MKNLLQLLIKFKLFINTCDFKLWGLVGNQLYAKQRKSKIFDFELIWNCINNLVFVVIAVVVS